MIPADPTDPPRAVIASGGGRYSDPWHPFDRTSARIAEILTADGWQVTVIDDPDLALASLAEAALLVVNAGDPWHNGPRARGADPAAQAGLRVAVERGIGILAVHTALASLRDYPLWRDTIGGEWQEGTSWHAPIGDAAIPVVDRAHPLTVDLDEIVVFDELYTDLAVDPEVRVLAAHEHDEASHPIVWVSDHPTRVVVTALGHDERSYESATNRTLLRDAARWVIGAAEE